MTSYVYSCRIVPLESKMFVSRNIRINHHAIEDDIPLGVDGGMNTCTVGQVYSCTTSIVNQSSIKGEKTRPFYIVPKRTKQRQ